MMCAPLRPNSSARPERLTRRLRLSCWDCHQTDTCLMSAGICDDLPELLTEREAAVRLRVKPSTVRAERVRGKLGFVRIGARIFYMSEQLSEYLKQQTIQPCPSSKIAQVKSEATGSAENRDETASKGPGAAPGMTSAPARRAVSALARQTFRLHPRSSRHGSSRTNAGTGRRQMKS
jgi:hypothetical protein